MSSKHEGPNMKIRQRLLCAALTLLTCGCTVGPDYHPPGVKVPAQWEETSVGSSAACGDLPGAWWKNFQDPELDSLIERALKTNLDLKIAEARVRQARAQLGIVKADYGPTVEASGSYKREQIGKNGFPPFKIPSTETDLYHAGFDALWEIDLFGGKRRADEAATADLSAVEYGRRDVLITLLSEVARNYTLARGGQRQLMIARDQIKSQEETLAITRSRLEHGAATELDVQRALALLSTLQSQVPTIETAIQSSIHRLGILLAQAPASLQQELSEPVRILAPPPEVPAGLPSSLLQRRPDIQRAERQLAAATARIGEAKADLFPKFSLTGSAGFTSVNTSDFFSPDSRVWSIGPSVQWRVFDMGRVRAGIRAQTAFRDQAFLMYEQTILGSLEEVENALTAYAKEQERFRSLEQAVEANQKTVDLAGRLYAKGLGNYLSLLDAQRTLYRAQDDLVRSERTVTLNLISLYKALGGGWAAAEKL